MLRRATTLCGATIHGRDGDIGVVEEILFDDVRWIVRYVLVETGDWLPGRWVLVSPVAFCGIDDARGRIDVALTRAQVATSPALAPCRPVSRAWEAAVCTHHGWPRYREEAGFPDDASLHRSRDAIGCGIRTAEGSLGHIKDLLLDETTWRIHRLAMDPRPPSPENRSVTVNGRGGCMADTGRRQWNAGKQVGGPEPSGTGDHALPAAVRTGPVTHLPVRAGATIRCAGRRMPSNGVTCRTACVFPDRSL